MLSPLICGEWDGCNVWLQWNDVSPEVGYRIRIRLRMEDERDWGDWLYIEDVVAFKRNWIVIPTWKPGYLCEAQVCSRVDEGQAWESAKEVTFLQSRCTFEIVSERGQTLHYLAGSEFHMVVDGAGCHYTLPKELQVPAGKAAVVEMVASVESGYCQLDYPGHFELRPSLGVVIRNVESSVDDVRETGRKVTVIKSQQRKAPLKIVFGSNHFNGTRNA